MEHRVFRISHPSASEQYQDADSTEQTGLTQRLQFTEIEVKRLHTDQLKEKQSKYLKQFYSHRTKQRSFVKVTNVPLLL